MLKRIKELLKLNEATLEQVLSVTDRDRLIKTCIANLEVSGESLSHFYMYIDSDTAEEIADELGDSEDVHSLDDLLNKYSDDEVVNTNAFKQFVYTNTEAKLDSVVDELEDTLDWRRDHSFVNLYRAIGFSSSGKFNRLTGEHGATNLSSWLEHLYVKGKHVGIFWADSFDKAKEFGNLNVSGDFYILKTNVENRYIDWYETIKLRMDLTLGEENEIRLFKGTPLTIETIYDETGDEIDISILEGKKLYA